MLFWTDHLSLSGHSLFVEMLELFKNFDLFLFAEQAIGDMAVDENRNKLPKLLFLNYLV